MHNSIFEAALHGWCMYMHGKRASGRTQQLINLVSDNDTIVCGMRSATQHIEAQLKRAEKTGVRVVCVASLSLTDVERLMLGKCSRIYFDHTFTEGYIYQGIVDQQNNMNSLIESHKKRAEKSNG